MLWYINYTINTYTRHLYICYYKRSSNLTDVNIELMLILYTINSYTYVCTHILVCTCALIHIHFTDTYIYLYDLCIRL